MTICFSILSKRYNLYITNSLRKCMKYLLGQEPAAAKLENI